MVSPRTFARWINEEGVPRKTPASPQGGRPRVKEDVQTLVLRLADENGWGYARIFAELKKLGVRLSKTSVANILREHGRGTGDDRGEGTWAEFLKRHAATLWACDYFSKKVWTTSGLVEFFVLFFIHVGSRRVHIAGMTRHPTQAWSAEQAGVVAEALAAEAEPATLLLRDFDTKFGKEFDRAFAAKGIQIKKIGPCKPNLNAVAERWVQSVKRECLDHCAQGEAVYEMRVGLSRSGYRTRPQTAGKLLWLRAMVGSDSGKGAA